MKIHSLKNNSIEVGITEEGGHLFPVRFFSGNDIFEPMHVSPWFDEIHDSSTPFMLKLLRGDFFCAPFGDSNILPEEQRGHGTSANGKWDLKDFSKDHVSLKLSQTISGAELVKDLYISMDEQVLYQKHTFIGGHGKIPVGHHAMLSIPEKAFISFSGFDFGGTPPDPIEPDRLKGRSALYYPQSFTEINKIKKADGGFADASFFPFDTMHEDLYMIISKRNLPFGWSAVSCPGEGWLWFSIKNVNVFPNTVVWLSNGGRYYPPFSSRHKNVIGIEETVSFFHLGHKASIEENFLNQQGYRTFIELSQGKIITMPYLFGAVKIPTNFGRVSSIEEFENGIEITDSANKKVKCKVNLNFIRNVK